MHTFRTDFWLYRLSYMAKIFADRLAAKFHSKLSSSLIWWPLECKIYQYLPPHKILLVHICYCFLRLINSFILNESVALDIPSLSVCVHVDVAHLAKFAELIDEVNLLRLLMQSRDADDISFDAFHAPELGSLRVAILAVDRQSFEFRMM